MQPKVVAARTPIFNCFFLPPMPITCKVIRSKRKTLSLQVHRDGSVVVRAPLFTLSFQIRSFVKKMQAWIEKQQKHFQKMPQITIRTFQDGATFLLLGAQYPLELTEASGKKKPSIRFENAFKVSAPTIKKGKELLEKWYRKEARRIFAQRLDEYATRHGLIYKALKLSSARTRWGSCSRQKNINLNWRLIMAPLDIIDYVIAHELAHTMHMNHSKRFWDQVEEIVPSHKTHKKWLKDFGRSLHI